jgi:6-pyruvoyltetrahydropterin/6-carboxytetrahydropterin synthase
MALGETTIELFKEEMKFSAGHFTIFSATERENLHGHNFSVHVSLTGLVGDDGLLADYGTLKHELARLCGEWNETFLLPTASPHLTIEATSANEIVARFHDETLRFLARDVTLLPARNISLEELARVLGERLIDEGFVHQAALSALMVKCSSGPGQSASWQWPADGK